MAGGAHTVRASYGRGHQVTRDTARGVLDSDLPGGLGALHRAPPHALMGAGDFLDACRHFGLDRLPFDVTTPRPTPGSGRAGRALPRSGRQGR